MEQLFDKLKKLVAKPENGLVGANVQFVQEHSLIVMSADRISAYSLARIVGVLKRYPNTMFSISPGGHSQPMKVELLVFPK